MSTVDTDPNRNAYQFFYDRAGFSHKPPQTREEGHAETARLLAEAYDRFRRGPYYIGLIPDPEPWQGDFPYDGPLWIVTLYGLDENMLEGVPLGSLGGVAAEEGDPYLYVVTAELALEYIPEVAS
jgi:hypothetical protein